MDLFKLLGKIAIDTSEMEEAFEKARNDGKAAQESLESAFGKMGNAAVAVGKTVLKGLAVGGAAVAGLVTSAVNAYADYEQLVGGVETLFGVGGKGLSEYAKSVGKTRQEAQAEYQELLKGQNLVLRNAEAAYKTAGMSANEYLETVTSFSASLLQSLNGDTKAAAEKADQAIVDMADNANKMGSSMESIQNAYQGFAKQNYTMLDNLKLGYGGTKEEMQRLLEDAEKLSGQKFDISSYADVVDAIHVIQTEMGITGTTAKEASTTISGSISSMKASWQNLMIGLAQDEADIPQLVNNVVSSGVTVLKNIIPVAKQVLMNLPAAISEISPEAGAAFQTIIDICISAFDILKAAIVPTFNVIKNVFNFIKNHTGLITAVAVAIGVVTAAITAYNVVQAVKAAMDAAEVTTLGALIAMKLASAAATLAAVAPYLLVAAAIAAVIAIGVALYKNWDTIKAKCSELYTNMKTKFSQIKESVVGKFNEIKSGITEKIDSAKEAVRNAIEKIKGFFNFKWSLPKIKLPHFSISGKFSLDPPSIPKISVDWYAKAMNNPMIMDKPTIFGYNAATGKFQGGGEAGSEMVGGTNTIMQMISEAVATQNSELVYYMQRLLQILAEYFPQVLEGMDRAVVLDSGVLVGELAVPMDKALGKLAVRKGRGI